MFFCALSGEPPQDAVVSAKSGQVYERRLIEKYVQEHGTDPVSGEKLDEADLITVKTNPKAAAPRPPTLTSVPALLHTLQNEWDALVLETFQLKQSYLATRQELSYALYAQDAATRVVARLIKERDAAREYARALASVQTSMGISGTAAEGDERMDEDGATAGGALPADVLADIEAKHAELSSVRKKRKAPAGSAAPADVKTFVATHTIPSLHSPAPAGITALALSTAQPGIFVTGGNDKVVQVYDRASDTVLATLKGHSKKVTRVALVEREGEPTLVLSASADKTARVWAHDAASGEYIPRTTVRSHKGELTGLAVHPLQTLAAVGGRDGAYSVHDLRAGRQLYFAPAAPAALESLAFHPDGALLGAGTAAGTVLMYDVRAGELAAELAGAGPADFGVHALGFSENGYQLLAPASEGTVAVWDLRNQKAVHTLELGAGFGVSAVAYDASAKMLGVAGAGGLRLFAHKTWEALATFEEGGPVADFAWTGLGKELWGAAGREIRIWGAPPA